MQSELTKIGLEKQLITCAIMCGLAVAVILVFYPKPYFPSLLAGLLVSYQILLGIGIGGLYWFASQIGYKLAANRQSTQSIVENYSRLDLSGWNPLWIASAAGFSEELLFRGALQPLLGIWVTSAIFVLAHIRAYRLNTFNKRVLVQALALFAISVVFGYVARYVGLVTAILVHTSMDVAGLYTVRRISPVQSTAAE